MEEWPKVRLGEILLFLRNGTTAHQSSVPTSYPVTRIETIAGGEINWSRVGYLQSPDERYRLQHGDVLFSHINSGAHMGKVALFADDLPLYHGMNLMLLRPDGMRADPRFVYRVLASEPGRAHARRECKSAVNQASLSQGDIAGFSFALPPLPEQQRIAEVLDTLDEAIHKTEEVIAKLQQVKHGLLHDLLTRGIDEHGELRDPDRHPEQFKDSELGRVPRDWEVRALHEVVDPSTAVTYGVVQPGPADPEGVLFVRGGDFPEGRIVLEKLRTITRAVHDQYRRTHLREGDVVVSLVGQPGSCAVVPAALENANVARQAALVRLQRELVIPEYLCVYIRSRNGKRALLGDTLGSVQQVVNLRDLRGLTLLLPSVDEQESISAREIAMNSAIDLRAAELNKLRAIKSALMHDLLTGRVRTSAT